MALFSKKETEVVCTCVASSLGYSSLREHQKNFVTDLVAGKMFLLYFQLATARVCAMLVYLALLISF